MIGRLARDLCRLTTIRLGVVTGTSSLGLLALIGILALEGAGLAAGSTSIFTGLETGA